MPAQPLDRGLGEGAVGVPPGRGPVVELVHRRVEEVRGHLRGTIGEEAHRLLRVHEQPLARRDLPARLARPGPKAELNCT